MIRNTTMIIAAAALAASLFGAEAQARGGGMGGAHMGAGMHMGGRHAGSGHGFERPREIQLPPGVSAPTMAAPMQQAPAIAPLAPRVGN